jgi:dihydrofolate reductase
MKVTLLMALTADGKIGKNSAHFPDWSGKEDKKRFRKMTLDAGVVIMGSATFNTIGRPLPGRKNIVLTRNADRLANRDNLFFTNRHPAEILGVLASEGFEHVILIGGARINSLFARESLIDEMILTYCPKIFGTGLGVFSEEVSMDLKLLSVEHLDENVISMHYKVLRQPHE